NVTGVQTCALPISQRDHAGFERDATDLAGGRSPENQAARVLRDREQLVDARSPAVAGAATLVAAGAPIEARPVGAGDAERAEVGRRRSVGRAAGRADAPDQPLGED